MELFETFTLTSMIRFGNPINNYQSSDSTTTLCFDILQPINDEIDHKEMPKSSLIAYYRPMTRAILIGSLTLHLSFFKILTVRKIRTRTFSPDYRPMTQLLLRYEKIDVEKYGSSTYYDRKLEIIYSIFDMIRCKFISFTSPCFDEVSSLCLRELHKIPLLQNCKIFQNVW